MREIDPRFSARIVDGKVEIVKTSNGAIVPAEEPMFLMRGRDKLALPLLLEYLKLAVADNCNDYQLDGIGDRINAFRQFKESHPDKMKQPGVTRGL